jgi:4-hydroxy-tetrahydrodipicolinate reductase
MRLVVVGAAGRMGQQLIRTIHTMDGVCVAGTVGTGGFPPQIGLWMFEP